MKTQPKDVRQHHVREGVWLRMKTTLPFADFLRGAFSIIKQFTELVGSQTTNAVFQMRGWQIHIDTINAVRGV